MLADPGEWPHSSIYPCLLLFPYPDLSREHALLSRESRRLQNRTVLSIISMGECHDCALLRLEDSHSSLQAVVFRSRINAGDSDKDFGWDVISFSSCWFASGQRFLFFVHLHISSSLNISWLIKKKKKNSLWELMRKVLSPFDTHSTCTLSHTARKHKVDLIAMMREFSFPLCYYDHYVHV